MVQSWATQVFGFWKQTLPWHVQLFNTITSSHHYRKRVCVRACVKEGGRGVCMWPKRESLCTWILIWWDGIGVRLLGIECVCVCAWELTLASDVTSLISRAPSILQAISFCCFAIWLLLLAGVLSRNNDADTVTALSNAVTQHLRQESLPHHYHGQYCWQWMLTNSRNDDLKCSNLRFWNQPFNIQRCFVQDSRMTHSTF